MSGQGVFHVGKVDLEWSNGAQAVTADGHLVGCLYYPATFDSEKSKSKYSTPAWLPSAAYARGYSEFLFGQPRHWKNFILRTVTWLIAMFVGRTPMECYQDAPLAEGDDLPFPVVLFSHGVGGNRYTYSTIATRLAAVGFIVFCAEHADGSASTVQLAGQGRYRYYETWTTKEERLRRTRYRVAEMKTAIRLLQDLSTGKDVPHLRLSGGAHVGRMWRGRMDLSSLALCGHSFGGATVTAMGASDPSVRCVLALDPWWPAVPEETEAVKRWSNPAPMLVMGSHDWNIPNDTGELKCGGDLQRSILRAASRRNLLQQEAEAGQIGDDGAASRGRGGGAVLLVLEGSLHHTFSDIVAFFGSQFRWLGELLGFKSHLDPQEGTELIMACLHAFLYLHLPMLPQQRARLLARTPTSWQGPSGILPLFESHSSRDLRPCLPNGVEDSTAGPLANGATGTGDGSWHPDVHREGARATGLRSTASFGNVESEGGAGGRAVREHLCVPHVIDGEDSMFRKIVGDQIYRLEVSL